MIAPLFFILLVALIGGLISKFIKLPSLVGYILAGVVGGVFFYFDSGTSQNIAQLGAILLLFSVGLELSLEKLIKVGKIAILGAILQIVIVSSISFWFLTVVGNIVPASALVLSLAFSLSSTALIVKILEDANETGTIQAEILTSWSLIQDLAVIPIVVLLPTLTLQDHTTWLSVASGSVLTTLLILGTVVLAGKIIAPYLTHLVAVTNSRELLVLLAVTLALGTASIVTLFGISAAFGAFLAGVVISKTQENHAIFSETRPLRDIFSILFFVALGFLVTPVFIITHILVILLLSAFVILLKTVVVFVLCLAFGYKGKTAIQISLGLAQIGEFAFVLFLIAGKMGIILPDLVSLGMATTLTTLLISALLSRSSVPIWRKLKELTKGSSFSGIFAAGRAASLPQRDQSLKNHIIICGYGRMGKWIGKALKEIGVDYVIVDYNHRVIHDALKAGLPAIYGDASLPEILAEVNIKEAKAIIITMPDRIAQEEIVSFCQKNFPEVKIMMRAHVDTDFKKFVDLNVDKIVQPEFEAALAIIKSILVASGHKKEDVNKKIKGLRLSHANL